MSVIATFELYDPIASCESPRQANGAHRGFCARGHQANLLDGRHKPADGLCHSDFSFCRSAIAKALLQLLLQRLDDGSMAMPENQRSPCAHIVQIAVSIRIGQPGTFATLKEQRVATDATEGTNRRIDTPGDHLAGAVEEFTGAFCMASGR